MQLRVPTGVGVGVIGVIGVIGVLISGFLVGGCVFDPSGLSFAGDADPAARDGGPGGDGAIDGDGDGADAACSPAPGGETCNGLDDDCDGAIDEGFDVGQACDGLDPDGCRDGQMVCNAAGEVVCEDPAGPAVDHCDGTDDDCNKGTLDGQGDPNVGLGCDGDDEDRCVEGVFACVDGVIVCGDATGPTVDLCNSVDDDCDPASLDGTEDPMLGMACDGVDLDLCTEGVYYSCAGGLLSCDDATGDLHELCNGLDDDCSGGTPDGMADLGVGMLCDGSTDGDLCAEGVTVCTGGVIGCSDATSTTPELCNGVDDDCDMVVDEGFGNSDPLCAGAILLGGGAVDGDRSNDTVATVGATEAWYRVEIRDTVAYSELLARVTLVSPAGADYDLHVYCESCGATPLFSSISHSGAMHTDLVTVTRPEVPMVDRSFDLLVEVRFHAGASLCGAWALTVEGNRTTNPRVECARP